MAAFRNILLLTILAQLLAFGQASAQAPDYLRPPFGLFWGEEASQIEKLLKGAKAKVTDKNKDGNIERWSVEGIIQPALKQTNFYFQEKSLVGIELQYANDAWDQAKYNTFMDKFRAKIEGRFGAGTMINREKGPQEDVSQSMVTYEWKQDDTNLQLVYFGVEKDDMAFRTVSLHYRYVPMEIPAVPDGDVMLEELPPIGDAPMEGDKKAPIEDVLPAKKEGESVDQLRPATSVASTDPTPQASPTPADASAPATPAADASPTPSPSPEAQASPAGSPSPAAP